MNPDSSLARTATDFALLALTDAAVKSALLLVLAMVAAWCCRKASAAKKHALWCGALAGALILPILSFALPEWRVPWLPEWRPAAMIAAPGAKSSAPAAPILEEKNSVAAGAETAAETVNSRDGGLATAPAATVPIAETTLSSTPSSVVAHSPASAVPSHPAAPITSHLSVAQFFGRWAGPLWLLGAVLALLPMLAGWTQAAWLTHRARHIDDPAWNALLAETLRALDLRRTVRLLAAPRMTMPFTWGAWHAVVLFPESVAAWPEARRRLVLIHELGHIKRWDWLTQTLGTFACALYWFNPLAWLASRQMRLEREQACDDLVLRCGPPPQDYARELLELAAHASRNRLLNWAAVPMARRSTLEDRLRAILDGKRNRAAVTRAVALGILALVAAIAIPIAMLRAAAPAPAASATDPALKKVAAILDDRKNSATANTTVPIASPDTTQPPVIIQLRDGQLSVLVNQWAAADPQAAVQWANVLPSPGAPAAGGPVGSGVYVPLPLATEPPNYTLVPNATGAPAFVPLPNVLANGAAASQSAAAAQAHELTRQQLLADIEAKWLNATSQNSDADAAAAWVRQVPSVGLSSINSPPVAPTRGSYTAPPPPPPSAPFPGFSVTANPPEAQAPPNNPGLAAENDAILQDPRYLLMADSISRDAATKMVTASGHVRVTVKERVLTGDRVDIDPDAGIITITGQAQAEDPAGALLAQGDQIVSHLDRNEMEVSGPRAKITGQGLFTAPPAGPSAPTSASPGRHAVQLQIFSKLEANPEPKMDKPSFSVSMSLPEPIEVLAGDESHTGVTEEIIVYAEGAPRPANPAIPDHMFPAAATHSRDSATRESYPIINESNPSSPANRAALPTPPLKAGIKYIIEYTQTIFEAPDSSDPATTWQGMSGTIVNGSTVTTFPAQPLFNGPARILWTRTLKSTFVTPAVIAATASPSPPPAPISAPPSPGFPAPPNVAATDATPTKRIKAEALLLEWPESADFKLNPPADADLKKSAASLPATVKVLDHPTVITNNGKEITIFTGNSGFPWSDDSNPNGNPGPINPGTTFKLLPTVTGDEVGYALHLSYVKATSGAQGQGNSALPVDASEVTTSGHAKAGQPVKIDLDPSPAGLKRAVVMVFTVIDPGNTVAPTTSAPARHPVVLPVYSRPEVKISAPGETGAGGWIMGNVTFTPAGPASAAPVTVPMGPTLGINFSSAHVEVEAGYNMQVGLTPQIFVYPESESRPAKPIFSETVPVGGITANLGFQYQIVLSGSGPGTSDAATSQGATITSGSGATTFGTLALKPETKYVVELVQSVFETPNSPDAGQFSSGPRQELWTRTQKTTFVTPVEAVISAAEAQK